MTDEKIDRLHNYETQSRYELVRLEINSSKSLVITFVDTFDLETKKIIFTKDQALTSKKLTYLYIRALRSAN